MTISGLDHLGELLLRVLSKMSTLCNYMLVSRILSEYSRLVDCLLLMMSGELQLKISNVTFQLLSFKDVIPVGKHAAEDKFLVLKSTELVVNST